jgi:hypothetical protein
MMNGRWRVFLAVLAAAALVMTLGACKLSNSSPDEQDDTALWESIVWTSFFAAARPDATQVMTLGVGDIDPGSGCLTENKYDPRFREAFVTYDYDSMPWRAGDPKQGNDGVLQNFFIWNSQTKVYEGGVFEWWEPRIGLTCGMINAMDRANGKAFMHKLPCSGDKVAFAWTNFAGTQRSNLVESTWP